QRPHVTLKLALAADGKVALAGRHPVAITGEAATARVHLMRAEHDAIMIGIGTAIADDPLLTCRLPGMSGRSPVRVVVDSALRLPVTSRLVGSAREAPLWVIGGTDASAAHEEALRARGVEVLRMAAAGRPEIGAVLRLLADRGITRLMVEGGPTLAASLVTVDRVDTAVLMRAPKPIGPVGIDALERLPLAALPQTPPPVPGASGAIRAQPEKRFFGTLCAVHRDSHQT